MIFLFFAAFFFPLSLAVMYLWNYTLAVVLHISTINFWQAAGLLLLSKILFGGFGGKNPGWQRHWKNDLQGKWQKMNPEEREKFKQEWKNKCRSWKHTTTETTAAGTE